MNTIETSIKATTNIQPLGPPPIADGRDGSKTRGLSLNDKALSTEGLTSEQLETARATLKDSVPMLKRFGSTPGLEPLYADFAIPIANSIARIDRALRARQREFLAGSVNEGTHIVRHARTAKLLGDDRRRNGNPLVRE